MLQGEEPEHKSYHRIVSAATSAEPEGITRPEKSTEHRITDYTARGFESEALNAVTSAR